ncbi:hypothetical protein JTE90_017230 [Oedothorax gibbosus]|uniref:Uncharacterized protein n=1 Tax=Oedothorax gibbosus TaxID=931172 RepID=A0AAV6VE06_9ARAC|nr:hypothetical protein JTE90_017230 [Oedothorax gibbosus]
MTWKPIEDTIIVKIADHVQSSKITKRTILQNVAKIYDPIGFIQPFVVRIKILLQKLWLLGVNWDDPLPCDILNTWNKIVSETSEMIDFPIPRKYFTEKNCSDISIHIFCDASLAAYGSCCYFRYKDSTNNWKTTFILSKSRIAPLKNKNLTLPKLELMAALVGARLGSYLTKVFPEFKRNYSILVRLKNHFVLDQSPSTELETVCV